MSEEQPTEIWQVNDVTPYRDVPVKVYSRRVGSRGEYEGYVDDPHASGRRLYRSGRVGGRGSKEVALEMAREWARENGMRPVVVSPYTKEPR